MNIIVGKVVGDVEGAMDGVMLVVDEVDGVDKQV